MRASADRTTVSAGWKVTAAAAVVAFALAGCSGAGGETPGPEASVVTGAESEAPAVDGAGEAEPESDSPWCVPGDVTDELEITYGDVQSASDEWSEDMGVEWRQYVPVTIKNVSDKACGFGLQFQAHPGDDAGAAAKHEIYTALKPGQSQHAQLFSLEGETDTQNAALAVEVDPVLIKGRTDWVLDYYDAELDVKGLGADKYGEQAMLADITVSKRNPGLPDPATNEEYTLLAGLDANGDIITLNRKDFWLFPRGEEPDGATYPVGFTAVAGINLPFPLSTYDDVVSWELATFQPRFLEEPPE